MKNGRIETEMVCTNIPNKGGINVEPAYAQAICKPINNWELSEPKLIGVWWIKLG